MRFRRCLCPETPWPRQTAVREAGSTALGFLPESGVPGPDRRGGLLALRVCVALLPPGNVTAFHRRTLRVSHLQASAPLSPGPRARGDAGAGPAPCVLWPPSLVAALTMSVRLSCCQHCQANYLFPLSCRLLQ